MKTKRDLIQICLWVAVLLQLATPRSSAQTIQNPGFETPVVGSVGNYNSYQYDPPGAGWTFIGNAGIAANGSGFAFYNAGTSRGNQFVFLQNVAGVGGSMSQTLSNFASGTYSFTFVASQRDIAGRDNSQNEGVTVLVDGTSVGTFTPADTGWYAFQTSPILLNAGNHVLTFTNLPVAGNATVRVDMVGLINEPRIATGAHHSLFLINGSLLAMGDNAGGELGDGTTTNIDRPEQVLANNVTAISGGGSHSLLIENGGSLWAMGANTDGQLGDGTYNNTNLPEQIVASNVTAIAAGFEHSLFLKSDGSLWAMGYDDNGQLGDGTYATNAPYGTNLPEQIVAGNVTAIAAGFEHSLFLKSDGSLWAMGYSDNGQLGDGTYNTTNRPEQIVASNVTAIAAGFVYSLFLKSDGSLWAMGNNGSGQLGDGTLNTTNRPEQIVASNVTAIAAGDSHSLFLKSDGSLWAFGNNGLGQLGDGTFNTTNRPEQIVASNVMAIAAGAYHSLFLKSDGSVWAMGYNYNGQLGDGTYNNTNRPVLIFSISTNVQFTANPSNGYFPLTVQFNCPGFDSGGNTITNWNWNFGDGAILAGQNPVHTYTNAGSYRPVLVATNNLGQMVPSFGPFISVGFNSGLVQNGGFETGDFTSWTESGDNNYAYVDNGSQSGIIPFSGNYAAVLASYSSPSYLSQIIPTQPGTTYLLSFWLDSPDGFTPNEFHVSWNGSPLLNETNLPALGWTNIQFLVTASATNTVLQFGFRDDPSILGLDDVSVVALPPIQFTANPTNGVEPLAVQFNCPGVDRTGNAITNWNWNFGDGTTSTNQNPSHVYTSSGIFNPGLIVTNNLGMISLVVGPSIKSSPQQPVTKVAAGYGHSLVLTSGGSLWTMGYNGDGQLGDGTDNNTNLPQLIMAGNVTAIAAGVFNSLFLKSDGSLWGMGDDGFGQFGDGNYGNYPNLPEHIVSSNVTVIAGGGEHCLFLKSDGSLWAAGDNTFGQLGDGTFNTRNLPEEIVASNVTAIAAGYWHSLFLKSDGSLWSVGRNDQGQLGDGTYNTAAPYGIAYPQQILASGVTAIAAGYGDSLFLKSDGSLWGMGNSKSDIPVQILASNVTAIASGGYDLYLTSDGGLWKMEFGFTASGGVVASNVTAMAEGYLFGLFIKSDGSLWTFGNNFYGQLGDGTTNTINNPEQIQIPISVQFTANPTIGVEPLTVQFSCPGIDSASNAIVNWNWNFGDGTASTNQNPSHLYITNGIFHPNLVATNNRGFAVLGSGPSITVTATPPVVVFSPLTNGQVVANLASLGGFVSYNFSAGSVVNFSIHELDINGGMGRWWNGTNFQSTSNVLTASLSGTNWSPAASVVLPQLNSGQSYQLTVTATNSTSSASATITNQAPITILNWDPGLTALGTMVLPNPNTNGGNYWFQITPQNPKVGVWRTALNVLAGTAYVYLQQGSPPTTTSYSYASQQAGSNGFVVDASKFSAGQTWYILVNASTNAQWNLVTGDAFVYNLGSLAADNSSSTNAFIGAEGMIFFQTTIPTNTLAWQLWLNGLSDAIYVKQSSAPDPISHDLSQAGQMLVVPPYLVPGAFNYYFVSVPGNPGTPIILDSRQQPVTSLPFTSFTNVTVGAANFPYVTYSVQVPVQQIAWQLNLTPSNGVSDIAARLDAVPNEFNNDAYSDVGGGVGNSISLVPPPAGSGSGSPGLSSGSYYVTVYGTGSFSCGFTNGSPVITPVCFIFSITNDAPNRVGWRYYSVLNINQQLGSLGWELLLSNAPAGSEIAVRRNAVPGQWNYRNYEYDNGTSPNSAGYVDQSSYINVLQQPGHQADIWYIGVYSPALALTNFVLTGQQFVPQPMSFDSSSNSLSVTNQLAGLWQFFEVTVPLDTNLLGWDLRLTNVTAGNPELVVSRNALPRSLSTYGPDWPYGDPWLGTAWSTGDQWLGGGDWTGDNRNSTGGPANVSMLAMGMGNPLQPGTYYIGVYDEYGNSADSYTLVSRGIGTNYSIPVVALNWATGALTNILVSREAAYYSLTIPSNTPSWQVRLAPTAGDALLLVQKDYLPNVVSGGSAVYGSPAPDGGIKLYKAGNQHYTLLP
ncbi:MAG: PKD domain-containing protein, partial [Verrucomicrobiia bacterium]